jgi:3-oxoacyl-[acyl-carrier-protein] synthase II
MSAAPKAVITGVGVVSPIGLGREAFWQALRSGQNGIRKVTTVDLGTLPVKFGGQIEGFDAKKHVKPRKAIKLMCRDVELGFAAATMAYEDAGLDGDQLDSERFGIIFGSEMLYGLPHELRDLFHNSVTEKGFDIRQFGGRILPDLFPLWMLKYLPNMAACHVGIALQAYGPTNTIVQGEASSLLALIEAVSVIERGWADVMITGGTGNRLKPVSLVHLSDQLWSHRDDDPAAASRPFDAERDGMVNGEGSGAFVIESAAHAEARGANILARVVGHGSAIDPRSFGQPFLGLGIRRSIEWALRAADCTSADVDHINAHGLSSVADDPVEAQAIQAVAADVPVTAPKSYFGNLGAGSGAVEMAASVLALANGEVPYTRNYEHPDTACPVNVIHKRTKPVEKPIALALNQSQTGQAVAVAMARN